MTYDDDSYNWERETRFDIEKREKVYDYPKDRVKTPKWEDDEFWEEY